MTNKIIIALMATVSILSAYSSSQTTTDPTIKNDSTSYPAMKNLLRVGQVNYSIDNIDSIESAHLPKIIDEGTIAVEAQKADTQAEMGNPITVDRAKQIEAVTKTLNKTQSPIKPERWVDLSTELDMPLDFLLTVALNESNFGTKGRAVATKNIYNVGNTDCGDGKAAAQDECNRFIESWELGVYEFAKLIKNCYFDENETIEIETWIDRDFRAVRCNFKGKRYMSDQFSKFKYKSRIKNIRAEFTK